MSLPGSPDEDFSDVERGQGGEVGDRVRMSIEVNDARTDAGGTELFRDAELTIRAPKLPDAGRPISTADAVAPLACATEPYEPV